MRETLLFYCRRSRGIGHLTRSFALACALCERFRVAFLNGGRLPEGIEVPQGIECIDLPPPGTDDSHTVVSRDAGIDVQAARAERRRLIHGAERTAELRSQLMARQVQQEPVLEKPARLRAPV